MRCELKKIHIIALIILMLFSTVIVSCAAIKSAGLPSNTQEVPSNIIEVPISWNKNREINKIVDAGPSKTPFNVNMFVTGYISNDFPSNKGIEEYSSNRAIDFEIEVLNTTTVPYSTLVQDLELISFTPSITIQSSEQFENSSKEYVLRKIFPEIKNVTLKPGESYSIKWTWNQKDKDGKKVEPGIFFFQLDSFDKSTPITYKGEDGNINVQEKFECMPFTTNLIKIID